MFLSRVEDSKIPLHTRLMDVTMTHDRYGRTTQCTNGALTHRVSSTGSPQSDGTLNNVSRIKIRHYRQLYSDSDDPIVFLSVTVSTSGHVRQYDDFVCLIFLDTHRESSMLPGVFPEESEHFRFFSSCMFDKYSGICRFDFNQNLHNESYYSHRFVYTSFHTFTSLLLTLVGHLLFLAHLRSYFHNNLSEWQMMCVHF